MAVRKLAGLAVDIAALLPDNTERLIKPEHVRGLIRDVLDSQTEAWGLLDITANTQTVNLNTTPVQLTGVWTGKLTDPNMGADQTVGTVTGHSTAGWNHIFQFICSMAGTQGRVITYRLRVNGTDTGVVGTIALAGTNDPQVLQLESFREAAPAGAVYSVMLSANQPVTVSIPRGYMRIIRKPTQ